MAQSLSYTVAADAGASWLTASGGGATPGSITIGLTSAALSLSPGSNQANVTVTCTSPACTGKSQTIAVSLTVTSPPPQLSVGNSLLSFASASTPPTAQSASLGLQNSGGGSITVNSVSCGAPWCTVGGPPATLLPGPGVQISVVADPAGLSGGFYRSSVEIATSAGSASVPVTFFVSQSASMNLAPAGTQFSMQAGGAPGNPSGSFLVSSAGGTINWSASVSGASWLTLNTPSGSATPTQPGAISYSINSSAAALTPQAYYATIEVSATGASNSPQDYQVVLNVAPANAAAKPDPEPAGLIFISAPGGSPPAQIVTVYTSSTTPAPYQAAASSNTGSWLSVASATGTTSSSAPDRSVVSVNTSGLSPGVYDEGVSYAFGSSGVRTVNVTLIIQPPGAGPSLQAAAKNALAPQPHASTCTPTTLVPTQTALVNNFSAPASWPTPLAVKLLNDCGNAVPNGQVVASFTNGDPPLALSLADSNSGLYAATWTPRTAAAQVTIEARATAPGLPAATAKIAGSVVPNSAPVLFTNGTVHAYNPQVGGALAPGTLVEIYGTNMASGTVPASTVPLATTMGGTTVLIGGIPAPLLYVSPGQVNAQVPFELDPSKQYQIVVSANGALTTPQPIQTAPTTPGIDAFRDGSLVAFHAADGSLISQTSPAKPGEYVVMFLLGMGQTSNPVVSGVASPLDPLARPAVSPTLTLNGADVPVAFAGLTPGFVGLYQINLLIPAGMPDGNATLVVSQGGSASNTTILPIRN